MDVNRQELARAAARGAAAVAPYVAPFPFNEAANEEQLIQSFWAEQSRALDEINNFKRHSLPIARVKRIMKSEEGIRMVSSEAPLLTAKACELFIGELVFRSWLRTFANRKKTIRRCNIVDAVARCESFDFLADIVRRDESVAAGAFGAGPAAGMPPFVMPPGVVIGDPAVDPVAYAAAHGEQGGADDAGRGAGANDASGGAGGVDDAPNN